MSPAKSFKMGLPEASGNECLFFRYLIGGDEGNMIRLERSSGKNVWDILNLRVSEAQRSFVASNDISIIEAYVAQNENGHAFPFGIYNDETPVGFCMIGYGVDDSWTDAPPIAKDSYNIWRLMIFLMKELWYSVGQTKNISCLLEKIDLALMSRL